LRIGLLRHGIAESDAQADSDFERQLTEEGRLDIERVLDVLAGWSWQPGAILHSPLVRTTQTADHVSARYPAIPVVPTDALALGFFDAILQAASRHEEPLLVGHEPTMGNLTGRLLGAPTGAVRFERGGFALVDVDRLPPTRPARLLLFLPPQSVAV
jgi:phosphohistidine phosphatase